MDLLSNNGIPAHHGIADIFLRLPGTNRIEPASGLHRGGSTWLLNLANQGLRVGCFGFPGTYPAENHANLVQISGFDTPDAKASGRGISPAHLRETIDALGGWHFSILPEDRRGGIDPSACADALIDDLKIKTRIIKEVEKDSKLRRLGLAYSAIGYHRASWLGILGPAVSARVQLSRE